MRYTVYTLWNYEDGLTRFAYPQRSVHSLREAKRIVALEEKEDYLGYKCHLIVDTLRKVRVYDSYPNWKRKELRRHREIFLTSTKAHTNA